MSDPSILFLINPNSGGGTSDSTLANLRAQVADRRGQTVLSENVAQAQRLVETTLREGCRRIIVGGGDDTLRDVLPSLLERPCEVGLVPLGTFNNLAQALGISLDPETALEQALSGTATGMDLGTVAGHLFTESAGVGYLAEAWSRAPQPEPSGFLRWVSGFVAAGSAFLDYEPISLEVCLDGEILEERVWDLTIANAPLFASNVPIAPHALLRDGLLDVCGFPARNRLEFLGSLPVIAQGHHLEELPGMLYRKAKRVDVKAPHPIPLRIDNTVVVGSEFHFEVLAGALQVVSPTAVRGESRR